jgi:hypothetical protein
MRAAVNHINRAYLERFGRRAYLAELLYALTGVIVTDVPANVADNAVPRRESLLSCLANSPFDHIDPGDYEGVFDAESDDFLIIPTADTSGRPGRERAVVRGDVVPQTETNSLCRYQILSPSITDEMAQSLIRQCVLQDLMDYNLVDGGLAIQFEKVK